MKQQRYVEPQFASIVMPLDNPICAGSVLEQNSIIKATNQEIVTIDFSDDSSFDLNWE